MQSAVKKASSLINIFSHDLDVFNNMGGILGGNGGPPEMGGSLGTMLLYSIQLPLSWEFWILNFGHIQKSREAFPIIIIIQLASY